MTISFNIAGEHLVSRRIRLSSVHLSEKVTSDGMGSGSWINFRT